MLDTLISHVATIAGIESNTSRDAVGIILNAAERQGAAFADAMFEKVPGARPLAATMGAEVSAATGEIARLIERTPGGRRHVTAMMISDLQARGIGHQAILGRFAGQPRQGDHARRVGWHSRSLIDYQTNLAKSRPLGGFFRSHPTCAFVISRDFKQPLVRCI